MRIHLSLVFLIGVMAISASSASSKEPQVLSVYPQCDYQVVDKVSVERRMNYDDDVITYDLMARAASNLIVKLKELAKEKHADGIVLTHREIDEKKQETWTKTRPKHFVVSYQAELIKQCAPQAGFPVRYAAYDEKGAPQKSLVLGGISGSEREIVFDLPKGNERHTPKLADTKVSLENGLFGVRLGSEYQDAIAVLGTPTVLISIGPNQQMVGYGRELWLLFDQGRLIQASNQQNLLSGELVNLLAFDDRLSSHKWQLPGKISEGSKVTEQALTGYTKITDGFRQSTQNARLTLHTDSFINPDDAQVTPKVVGFTLESLGQSTAHSFDIAPASQVYSAIATYLDAPGGRTLTPAEFSAQPIAKIWVDEMTERLVYDNHLIDELAGKEVSKLIFLEEVFKAEVVKSSSTWQFMRVAQGDTIEQVLNKTGDSAFELGDTVEVTADAYLKNLFFYDSGDNMLLYSAEISIY